MKPKDKSLEVFKVLCGGCQRLRYWDEEKQFSSDSCPECGSNNIKTTTTRVIE